MVVQWQRDLDKRSAFNLVFSEKQLESLTVRYLLSFHEDGTTLF